MKALAYPPSLILGILCLFSAGLRGADFTSDWQNQHDRVWIGPAFWANPLENWRIDDGRLECISGDPNQSVHLLTCQLGDEPGTFEISAVVGLQEGSEGDGSVGFEIGIRSELGDYRSSLLRGSGITFRLHADGNVQFGSGGLVKTEGFQWPPEGVRMKLRVRPQEDRYLVLAGFSSLDADAETFSTSVVTGATGDQLAGNIALIVNQAERGAGRQPRNSSARFWLRDLKVSGTHVVEEPDQAFGPILYAMHTLSRGVVKMTAQMPPLGAGDNQSVVLQIPLEFAEELLAVPGVEVTAPAQGNSATAVLWTPVARANIDPLSRTAHFRIPYWPDDRDVPYRLVYTMRPRVGDPREYEFTGTIRHDPVEKETISMAGFTGHQDTAFPNELLVSNVLKHDPDLCLFTGDQIYEGNGGFGVIRGRADRATLNYLGKIWLWGWSFRDVLRDRPSFVLPDDHDVYQGNIWGEGGKPTQNGMADHDSGGFAEPADFINAVFRTQAGHHPDAYDPTPMMQGIDCWFGDCVYGRIGFAIIEDRYFKSGPGGKVNSWPGRPDHVKDPNFDTSKLDKPGLVLLGDRQEQFLEEWAADWLGVDMKCVCSQTIFCNLANYHGPSQEFIFADLDSNGWPHTGRNNAVAVMRQGLAFHYAGDQHLPSIVHHGIDTWRDAGWSFCVPSTAAGYPRSWRPDDEGRPVQNRPEPGLHDTGDYRDAFGNLMSVYAIGNPERMNRRPILELLHDKASGYGLVHFHKPDRTITMECFRLIFDADNPQPEDQFPGWPRTISMFENDGREAVAWLPTIEVKGITDPVVQVIDEANGETLYTVRIPGTSWRPKVFHEGTYTVDVSDPDSEQGTTLTGVESESADAGSTVEVAFE